MARFKKVKVGRRSLKRGDALNQRGPGPNERHIDQGVSQAAAKLRQRARARK